jgi:histone acetyltransferase
MILSKNQWVIIYFNFALDLQTLERGLETGNYKTKECFVKDVKKIFSNAKQYNKANSIYHKYAAAMEIFIEEDLKNLKEA